MQFVVRVDASGLIGTGHVMRCLTLAEGLRKRGSNTTFISREHEGNLCDLIEERGFSVTRLPADGAGEMSMKGPAHASWLGCTWQQDAEITRRAIVEAGVRPDWLIVDHYALDLRWEETMRPLVERIMVIDDLADRNHDCNLLLDQNLVADLESRYYGKVPLHCGLLLGPANALLHPVYAELHERTPPRMGPITRILNYFGGADRQNLTGRVLKSFLALRRVDIDIDVVLAVHSPHEESIRLQAAEHGNVHIHSGLNSLAPLMVASDLAVGAGGATNWERLCLGLPALVITLAENQRAITECLSQKGLVKWLGHQDEIDDDIIYRAIDKAVSTGLDESWSRACSAVVDGRGLQIVCGALTVTADSTLTIRPARMDDENLLLEWANDKETRANAFSIAPISAASHGQWFRKRMRELEECRIYIVQTEDCIPVGQVRFDRHELGWEIDYSVAQVFRGRALGARILKLATKRLRTDHPGATVIGRVKKSNLQSRRVFEALAFELVPGTDENILEYRDVC
jgi:UDP-2,4-diacetamido-2,4,6-trideoxy-beta-L-altropyranose hydrolase